MNNDPAAETAAAADAAALAAAKRRDASQLALEILKAMATIIADGDAITISKDWGYGTGTIIINGSHTHFGSDTGITDESFFKFVSGMHQCLSGGGLSWVAATSQPAEADHADAAAAILQACEGRAGGPAIAAALHELADRVTPANGSRRNNEIRDEILAIAAEVAQ